MIPKLIPLETLLRWLWEDNPKLHQDVLIQFSMSEFGFNDRVGVCSKFTLILEGHGRLGNLKRMKDLLAQGDTSIKVPVNIEVDEVLGDWLIPCDDHDHFTSREEAYSYALMHNRSGSTGLDLRDYDVGKLQKAITKASAGKQMGFELPGFGANDFAAGSTGLGIGSGATGSTPAPEGQPAVGQLPKAAVFDPAALPDAPAYQPNQAPQSFMAMITAPDRERFLRMLSALTFGERKSMPEGARFASVEGMKFLEEWERLLVAKEALVIPAVIGEVPAKPLPGQITLAGEEVTAETQSLTLMEGLTPAPPPAPAYNAVKEPNWDNEGKCMTCQGKGHTGQRSMPGGTFKIWCSDCNGAGTRTAWLSQHEGAQDVNGQTITAGTAG